MLDRRRFLTLAGMTALAVTAPKLPLSPGVRSEAMAGDDATEHDGLLDTFTTYIRNTDADAVAGIPGLSMPAGRTRSGLPVGMELDGPMGSDRLLLSVGLALEESAFRPLRAPKLAIAEDS